MQKLLCQLLLTVTLISCTTDSSKTEEVIDPNLITGEVVDRNGDPITDVDIFVIYISESVNAQDSNLNSYPNPFISSTTVGITNRTVSFEYELKAVNVDKTKEIEVINQVLGDESYHTFYWEPEPEIEKGIYILQDNLDNERVVLYSPVINSEIRFNGDRKPVGAGYAFGRRIGEKVATTNKNGAFTFEKDQLIQSDESLEIVRTDETGLELGHFIISDRINVVAYIAEEIYSFKEIDYKEEKVFDLKMVMP